MKRGATRPFSFVYEVSGSVRNGQSLPAECEPDDAGSEKRQWCRFRYALRTTLIASAFGRRQQTGPHHAGCGAFSVDDVETDVDTEVIAAGVCGERACRKPGGRQCERKRSRERIAAAVAA